MRVIYKYLAIKEATHNMNFYNIALIGMLGNETNKNSPTRYAWNIRDKQITYTRNDNADSNFACKKAKTLPHYITIQDRFWQPSPCTPSSPFLTGSVSSSLLHLVKRFHKMSKAAEHNKQERGVIKKFMARQKVETTSQKHVYIIMSNREDCSTRLPRRLGHNKQLQVMSGPFKHHAHSSGEYICWRDFQFNSCTSKISLSSAK